MPKDSVCAEVGVWKGEFSDLILQHTQPQLLHLIDPWEFLETGYDAAWYGGAEARNQADMDKLYEGVLERFSAQLRSGQVAIHRMHSAEAARMFSTDYFDWIYIDGNHRYEFVKQDLAAFYPTIKGGGSITGDDYAVTGWWDDGVTRAVDEFAASTGARLEVVDHQFIIRKP